MKKVRVLLAGLGRIGQSLEDDPFRRKPCTHAGTILHSSFANQLELIAVMDRNSEKIRSFLQRFSRSRSQPIAIAEYTEFPKEKRDLEKVDLAVVATSSSSHSDLVRKFLNSGVKNILVEKPVALNSKDALTLLDLCQKKRARIWVNHERRYHPIYRYFRNELKKGNLGRILRIQASVLTSGFDPGHAFSKDAIGPLLHDGTHAIDFIQWLLGDPIRVHSKLTYSNTYPGIEERVVAWLEYRDEVEVFLEVGGYRKYFQFEIDIQTDSARILLSNDGIRFWKSGKSKLYKGFRSLQESLLPYPIRSLKDTNPFLVLYKSIYKSITRNLPPETGDIQDNISILKILERIQKT